VEDHVELDNLGLGGHKIAVVNLQEGMVIPIGPEVGHQLKMKVGVEEAGIEEGGVEEDRTEEGGVEEARAEEGRAEERRAVY